jgi:GNAT superfamily N-acetyltransferase
MESLLEIYKQLNDLGYTLEPFNQKDELQLYEIFRTVVDSGGLFPFESSSIQEFYRQFFDTQAHVYVCRSSTSEVVGGFYIKPNFPDRSRYIANAAYMLQDIYRGKGIGSLIVKASLYIAKDLGFQAMQFNRVFSQNISAIKLYQKLGFSIIGTIPEAFRNLDGTSQEGYIMYRTLENF